MIKSVKIENYKSIQELEVDVGRFNVIIGENGAGKSNFLEALALFGAAEADKLDNEFLVSRGIRACIPAKMFSLFEENGLSTINISLNQKDSKNTHKYSIVSKNSNYSSLSKTYHIESNDKKNSSEFISKFQYAKHLIAEIDVLISDSEEAINKEDDYYEDTINTIATDAEKINKKNKELKQLLDYMDNESEIRVYIENFLLYSPENTALRNFYREGQIEPLGINGEGLLKLLKVMQESEPAAFQDVLTCLKLFDWFETIDVPKDLSSMEDKVSIKDKYLTTIFDQRSANEGFLFVLFYAALFCSQYTPKIFAIDNIDASFNPKLCTVLIKKLVELAKKYDKQVFVTTHNPAILDGVDLGDEEQKLFVASRNKQGHTRFKTLTLADKPKSSTGEPIRLSEAFLRGYLGGLPKNF